ncbi:MAG TPA: SDR family oxidoreductase [Bacteroidia bacterium]
MEGYKNKIVWITGASSGIGEALVYEFAKAGSKVVLSARRKEELERVVKTAALAEGNFLVLPFDLADISSFSSHVERVISAFGRIDVLVNNGGFSQRAEALQTPLDIDRKIMEVNYFANIALGKLALAHMVKQKSGHIVVISSIAGKFGFYLRSAYSAAKHALHGFYESLRLENEKYGVKVTIVCPGKIKTNVSLNAVTADGSTHGQMDESHVNSMSPEQCAREIITAMLSNKEEILIGGRELKAVFVKRFFPGLFGRIIRKQSPY